MGSAKTSIIHDDCTHVSTNRARKSRPMGTGALSSRGRSSAAKKVEKAVTVLEKISSPPKNSSTMLMVRRMSSSARNSAWRNAPKSQAAPK